MTQGLEADPGSRRQAGGDTHPKGQVGSDGDSGAQVDVAMLVADKEGGVALGLSLHPDATTMLSAWLQPLCKRGGQAISIPERTPGCENYRRRFEP